MRWQGTVLAYVAALALLTGGCGGSTNTISLGGGTSTSSSGSSSSGSGSTASPAGIWTGSDPATGLSLTADGNLGRAQLTKQLR